MNNKSEPTKVETRDRQQKAQEVLPKYLTIIESDLMKMTHYLKDGVQVAIVAKDEALAEKLAEHYVVADELTKDFMKLTRKIID